MDHEGAGSTLIQVGAMTPSVGAMGMGHPRRKSWGGVVLHLAEVIDRYWRANEGIDHQRRLLTAVVAGGMHACTAEAGTIQKKTCTPLHFQTHITPSTVGNIVNRCFAR